MPSNDLLIHIPDYQQPVATLRKPSVIPASHDGGKQTILDHPTHVLAAQPKVRMHLCTGESLLSSMPAVSLLTENVLRIAVYTAGRSYGHLPPMGQQLSADRIQRLVLGVAELLQAELLADPGCDLGQIEEELRAMSRCLCAGFRGRLGEHAWNSASDNYADGDVDNER